MHTYATQSFDSSFAMNIKPATSLPHEVRDDIHGQGEDNGGVLLCRDGVESLEVAKLKG